MPRRISWCVALALLAACGDRPSSSNNDANSATDCEAWCSKENACPGAKTQDCASICTSMDSLVPGTGCSSEYGDFMTCMAGNDSQICTSGASPCAAQSSTYESCLATYCSSNPSGCITLSFLPSMQTYNCSLTDSSNVQQCWAWSQFAPSSADIVNSYFSNVCLTMSANAIAVAACPTIGTVGVCNYTNTAPGDGYDTAVTATTYFYSNGLVTAQSECTALNGANGGAITTSWQ